MRRSEAGFSLPELIVAVAIVAMLLAAGGWWLMASHPGTMRASVDQFDNAMAVVKSLAPSTGNGATVAFLPRFRDGRQVPGYVMKVYRGRPRHDGEVTDANIDSYVSDAQVSEKTFGTVPFALFFDSAGDPTGTSAYPHVDASGNVSFPAIAQQPQCPSGGIVLTFRSPQGATDTRTLQCNVSVFGYAPPNPSPTPNKPGIAPDAVTSYYVTGAPHLRFVTSEFGYTHWFANTGGTCSGIANYPASWPYSQPQNPAEATLPANPPSNPFSWPNNNGGSMNDAPATFLLQPAAPGMCDTVVADEYGQYVSEHVTVMSDLTLLSMSPSQEADMPTKTITFTASNASPVTITIGKTFDDEQLRPMLGGSCGSFGASGFTTISSVRTDGLPVGSASFTIAPNGNYGSCDLSIVSQYRGDPAVTVHVILQKPPKMKTWPLYVKYGANGTNVGAAGVRREWNVATAINAALGGGTAFAAGTCPAKAYTDAATTQIDGGTHTFPGGLTVVVDAVTGCYDGSLVAYEPGGNSSSYYPYQSTCGTSLGLGRASTGSAASFPTVAGPANPSCAVTLQDSSNSGQGTTGNGLINVRVVSSQKYASTQQSFSKSFMVGACKPIKGQETSCGEGDSYCPSACEVVGDPNASNGSYVYQSNDNGFTWTFEAVYYADSSQSGGGIWMVCQSGALVPADATIEASLNALSIDYTGSATTLTEIANGTYAWSPTPPPGMNGLKPGTDSSGNMNYCS